MKEAWNYGTGIAYLLITLHGFAFGFIFKFLLVYISACIYSQWQSNEKEQEDFLWKAKLQPLLLIHISAVSQIQSFPSISHNLTSLISPNSLIAWSYVGGSSFSWASRQSQKALCTISLTFFSKLWINVFKRMILVSAPPYKDNLQLLKHSV